ncbi:hypothetical protein BGZ76_005316 [Entomortierella beljakovae]|nr:hypothetical protein BGZ76_005316 [Entomortierella beljakovae]
MEDKINLTYVIMGDWTSSASDVDIDKNLKVSKLKKAIRDRKFPDLKDHDDLKLWEADIPTGKGFPIKEIKEVDIDGKEELQGGGLISGYFDKDGPANRIHIIVGRTKGIAVAIDSSSTAALCNTASYDPEEGNYSNSDVVLGNKG